MTISLIVAMDKNRVIGKDNSLPWHLPADLKFFKEMTDGTTVVMGRKCFESIGRPLPNRKNIVLSRAAFTHEGVEWCSSIDEILELPQDIFIIGGSQIYEAFLPYIDVLYITEIEHEFDGDTFFPEIDMEEWSETALIKGTVDESNRFNHTFHIYQKIKK